MSTDAFAPVAFPSLQNRARGDEAHAAGYAAGYAEGSRLAREELARLARELEEQHAELLRHGRERIERAVDVLNTALRTTLEAVTPQLVEAHDTLAQAAFELAEAVVGCELDDAQHSAASIVARVLEHPEVDGALAIRLSPADLEALDAAILDRVNATVTADPALGRGDGIVSFADGYLDARIESALARARSALLGEESP